MQSGPAKAVLDVASIAMNVAGIAKDRLWIGRLAPRVLSRLLLARGKVVMAFDVEIVKLLVDFFVLLLLLSLATWRDQLFGVISCRVSVVRGNCTAIDGWQSKDVVRVTQGFRQNITK